MEIAQGEISSLKRERGDLSREKRALLVKISDTEKKSASLASANAILDAEIQRLNEHISEQRPASFSVTDIEILNALSHEVSQLFLPPTEVVSLGSGPLNENDFEWPEIILEEDYGEPVYLRGSWERVEESPLYRMGYQVGITHGQSRSNRRSLLTSAYQDKIPDVEDDDYMEEWGRPRQSKRLWRIAHHIAWLIRSRKSIYSMRFAVRDWQEDLDWLEVRFYTNRMRFQWPCG